MTQDLFIKYLLENDCSLIKSEDENFYKCRRRNYKSDIQIQAVLPAIEPEDDVIDFVVYHVCQQLRVELPDGYKNHDNN